MKINGSAANVISTVRTRTSARLAVVRMAAAAARAKAASATSHHHHHLGHHSRVGPSGHHHHHHHHHSYHHPHHQVAPLKVHLSQQHRAAAHYRNHHHHKVGGGGGGTGSGSGSGGGGGNRNRGNMFESYQLWAMKTYGDSAKTKTVTRKKYNRIMKMLKGEEQTNAENSKFRFWVKAKGFRIGPPPDHNVKLHKGDVEVLYVVCYTQNKYGSSMAAEDEEEGGGVVGGGSANCSSVVYKKVAVVEDFFDIIYNVHVEMDGRGGKHAGQKKTYKAIAEMYAFLPREAVTKFLMQCSDCQKRMHPGGASTFSSTSAQGSASGGANKAPSAEGPVDAHSSGTAFNSNHNHGAGSVAKEEKGGGGDPPEINFSLPITTTYLKHLRSLGYSEEEVLNDSRENHEDDDAMDHEDSINSNDVHLSNSELGSPLPINEQMSPNSCKEVLSPTSNVRSTEEEEGVGGYDDHPLDMTTAGDGVATSPDWSHHSASPPPLSPKWGGGKGPREGNHQLPLDMCHGGADSGATAAANPTNAFEPSPTYAHRYSLATRNHANRHHHHHRRNCNDKAAYRSNYPEVENGEDQLASGVETGQVTVKDEDEEDEDEADDEKTPQTCDPERLKAFNLFVRLFVDENLDRMVPISKQPKEKIQAIMDSCSRQFPEFSERSRKRIRTYLKSCRRTKRCRDQNGFDPARPTPPHLTSAMAEQILANACENESTNAKRMRLGLEPICASLPGERESAKRIVEPVIQQPSNLRSYISDSHRNGAGALANGGGTGGAHRLNSHHGSVISSRGTSPSRFTPNAPASIKSEHNKSSSHNQYSKTGPADLSMKRNHLGLSIHQQHQGSAGGGGGGGGSQSGGGQSKCPLNPSEVNAVRQLIAGYRESAAFLVRSADELEQLLLQQN